MDISYFIKIQNAFCTNNKKEKELAKINKEMSKHFDDTSDTEEVLINGEKKRLMIIKDTDSNVFKKKIKACHCDKFNLGDYVVWNNQYWIIALIDPDEKTWHRGYMYLCTVPLRWQNSVGEIVERYAYSEDFTKYSSGVKGNSTITIGDNQYGLTLPIDDETKRLKRDMRFPIDLEDAGQPDIYVLTNRKVNLNNNVYFGRGGTMTITLSYDFFSNKKDKLVDFNGQKVWICDYQSSLEQENNSSISDNTTKVTSYITGNTDLKIGYPRTYTVTFKDKNGNDVDVDFKWDVVSDFEVDKNVNGNSIELCVEDERYIGTNFLLQVIGLNDKLITEIKINVIDSF